MKKRRFESPSNKKRKSQPPIRPGISGTASLVADESFIESQTAMLQRFSSTQQRAILANIGRTQGNRQVQRIVAADSEDRVAQTRLNAAPQAKLEAEQGTDLMTTILDLLRSLGFSIEQSAEIMAGNEPKTEHKPATKGTPVKSENRQYKVVHGKNFATALDGVAVKSSLLGKMERMAAFASDNNLVTGNIYFSAGMRSPKKAHRWSTAYQIRQGNISLDKLASLPDGKDRDGNVWYKPGWTMKEAKANARKIWKGALAAEGYPKGDERREPNTFGGGITRHATGKAIDATFRWNWSKEDGQEINREKVSRLKAAVEKRWPKSPGKKEEVFAIIDGFIKRGSYSNTAYDTVEAFGLTRPLLHTPGAPEDWHYEEA